MTQTTVDGIPEHVGQPRFPTPFEVLLGVVDQIVAAGVRDSATGVLGARPWRDRAAAALTAGDGSVSAVVILDVDDFKEVNDQQGHPAGDVVLAAVVNALRCEVRQVDLVGRVGGDEFALLLRDVQDAESATAVAERIRARVARMRPVMESQAGPVTVRAVTVSIGGVLVPVAPDPGDGGAAYLASAYGLADQVLYRVKRSGGDAARVVVPDAAAMLAASAR